MHKISNVDAEAKIGTCEICGDATPVFVRKNGKYSWWACRIKRRDQNKKWMNDNYKPTSHRLYRYGMTDDQFEQRLREQNSQCKICERMLVVGDIHIDHDHACCPSRNSCGKCIRGLLCKKCNSALGYLEDNIHSLEKAILYLTQANSTKGVME